MAQKCRFSQGLAMISNPMAEVATGRFAIDLYYTGLNATARVTEQGAGSSTTMELGRDYTVHVPYSIPARNVTWFTFE